MEISWIAIRDRFGLRKRQAAWALGAAGVLMMVSASVCAQSTAAIPTSATAATIAPGTIITAENWANYQQFMPAGMIALFKGAYDLKMPADVKMEIGPAKVYPLPRNYLAATEKYSPGVTIQQLSNGGLTLQGYRGGQPFPHPQEPQRGWKMLANVWYRYVPHLIADSYGTVCGQNSFGNISCTADEFVAHQLSYNTDPGIPATVPGGEGKFYTEWIMTLEPENERYSASLVVSPVDLTQPQVIYAFVPSLRRAQPVSSNARCTTYAGSDLTADEYRYGFNGNLTQVKADFVAERKMIGLLDIAMPTGQFPDGYDMPLGWPQPSWGKWQVRDIAEISVSKLPSEASGYCYGKREMYIDEASYATLWEDLYDMDMKPWKFAGFFLETIDVPGVGPVNSSGAAVEAFWDFQNKHSSFLSDPGKGRPLYVNEQAPASYNDITRYTTASGLNEIMR
jgi:Protein of unknown function (DUF1329)